MKDMEYHVANFATFVSKTLIFSSKKWMNLISIWLSIVLIKYLNWPLYLWFHLFQIEFQIELALRARSILKSRVWFQTQIALHSVQLPL